MLKDGLAAQLQGYDLSSQGGTRRRNTLKQGVADLFNDAENYDLSQKKQAA